LIDVACGGSFGYEDEGLVQTLNHAFRPEIIGFAAVGLIRIKDRMNLKRVVAMVVGVSTFLLLEPGVVDYRYTFILFPAILPLAGLGSFELTNFAFARVSLSPLGRRRLSILLQVLALVTYAGETNLIVIKYVPFPWKQYVDLTIAGSQ
jgi:hypothetical protein